MLLPEIRAPRVSLPLRLHNHTADLVVASATSLRRILWRSPSLAGRPGYPDKDSPANLP